MASLNNLKTKWAQEISRQESLDAELVVVALKCDLREGASQEKPGNETPNPSEIVSYEAGIEAARETGAKFYLGMSLVPFSCPSRC